MLAQFEQVQAMMKQMQKGGVGKMMRALGALGGAPRGLPGGPRK